MEAYPIDGPHWTKRTALMAARRHLARYGGRASLGDRIFVHGPDGERIEVTEGRHGRRSGERPKTKSDRSWTHPVPLPKSESTNDLE